MQDIIIPKYPIAKEKKQIDNKINTIAFASCLDMFTCKDSLDLEKNIPTPDANNISPAIVGKNPGPMLLRLPKRRVAE